MQLFPLTAVLGSAFLHASWNAVLKRSKDTTAAALVLVVGATVVSAGLTVFMGPSDVPRKALPWVAAVALSEGLYFFFLSKALSALPLGSAYGLSRGGGLMVTWPLSVGLLHEAWTPRAGVGIGCLVLGLLASVTSVGSRKGLLWAFACATAVGLYPLFYKQSLELGVSAYPLFCLSMAGSVPIQLALLGRGAAKRMRQELGRRPLVLVLTSFIVAASFLLLLVALRTEGAARLTALRNTSVLFAYVFGWVAGEQLTPRTLVSSVAITFGAVLLSL